jgi:multicomponent Na+:H+ antiporter subunit G
MNFLDLAGKSVLVAGAFCALVGAVGLIRFPDVYSRLHASTVAVAGGAGLSLTGIALCYFASPYSLKAFLVVLFLFCTAPVGAHAISRAAYRAGIKPWLKEPDRDLLREVGNR